MATRDRREYLTATVLDQGFLDRSQDNLENKIEMVADVEGPAGTIRVSDRNKYKDGYFYEAMTQFPVIKRSLGEWLSPELEFSKLTISLANVDGRFNKYLPGGANYSGWIGKGLDVSIGLRDVGSTYFTIYSGHVTDVGGVQRDRKQLTLITRDDFDRLNQQFPRQALTQATYPDLEDNYVGLLLPVIYGDWTTRVNTHGATIPGQGASIPAWPTNGKAVGVLAGTSNLALIISAVDNLSFNTSHVYLKRSDTLYQFNAADITAVSGNKIFEIKQVASGGTTLIEGSLYQYQAGDQFYCRIQGKDLGAYSDNLVEQARDILIEYGGAVSGDFDANWNTYRAKNTPVQSNISLLKSRVWLQQPQGAMSYALSMLEQCRLEAFVSRQQKIKLSSLHFEDFPTTPGFTVRNWDIEEGTFTPQLDERNVWNRAKADYGFDPSLNEQGFSTSIFRNDAAITQLGREISKKVVFPNLYIEGQVTNQLKEMLRLASGYAEFIEVTLSPRFLLQELGDFVLLNVSMGSTILENVPAQIREISHDAKGMRMPVKLWSMQMIPYPGYAPSYPGIVGGSNATITEET